MGFMDEFNKYFVEIITKKYLDCNGRARRKEFWMFGLFQILVFIVIGIIDYVLFDSLLLYYLAGLGFLLPNWCIRVRRMHDLDKQWTWILITLIPLIGGIWFFVLTVLPGTEGDNQFGPDPKAPDNLPNAY